MMMLRNACNTKQIICKYQIHKPAISLAVSRLMQIRCQSYFHQTPKAQHTFLNKPTSLTSTRNDFYRNHCLRENCTPLVTPRLQRLSTQPNCHNDHGFAKDISEEGYDKVYNMIYQQHDHRHGPWLKILQSAQNVLKGQTNVRILDIGSGPGGVAAMLASNFPNADVSK